MDYQGRPGAERKVFGAECTNLGEVFSRRSPYPVRDVTHRAQQNDVLPARQETARWEEPLSEDERSG
jgi:hypothetical protein